MLGHIRGTKSVPFAEYDFKKKNFLTPTTVTQGTPNASKLYFSVVDFDAIFEQLAGAIANSGTLQGVLEESDDDDTYTTVKEVDDHGVVGDDVALAVASVAGDVQQVKVRITKPYVRYTATVSVSTGTVVTAASLCC